MNIGTVIEGGQQLADEISQCAATFAAHAASTTAPPPDIDQQLLVECLDWIRMNGDVDHPRISSISQTMTAATTLIEAAYAFIAERRRS